MPRITMRPGDRSPGRVVASMRPGRNAPDNLVLGDRRDPEAEASMRPGRNAPDNVERHVSFIQEGTCFNEAGAKCPG